MKVGTYSRTCQWLFPDLLGFAMAELVGLDSKSLEDIGMLDVCSACRYIGNAWEWTLSKSCPQPMILGNHWTNDSFLPSPQVMPLRDTCFTLVTEISTAFNSRDIWLDFVLLINFLPFPVSPFQAPSHCFLGLADEQHLRFWFNVSLLMKNGSLLSIKLAAGEWVKKLEPNNGGHWVYLIHGIERCAQEEGENS